MTKTGKLQADNPSIMMDCFIDESPTIHDVTMAGVTFRLRSLTAGEMRDVHAEAKVPADGKVQGTTIERTDLIEVQILTVAFAMGLKKTYGNEGWDANRDLTLDNVRLLNEAIVVDLYLAHSRFFRSDIVDVGESKSDD